ncbi:nitrate- and nitrite sensing domain-containing protein, partial [Sulfurimonas sp.]|uniref:nitrate- and nitrite sensing domain-containing protein n=1 Tax=Sulfurimonas sp. TaxID=2022749 RepID=UPI0019E149F4
MFNNISIKLKMALMVVVPVLVILLWLTTDSFNSYKEVKALEKISELVLFSQKSSSLVHNLQKERGASAGFISSNGAKFSSELLSIRKDTDETLLELKRFYSLISLDEYSQSMRTKMQKAVDALTKIGEIRKSVDTLSVAVSVPVSYYSSLNEAFISAIEEIIKMSDNAQTNNEINAFVNFLSAKERAGIERAVLSSTFSRDSFAPGFHNKFIGLLSEQNSFTKKFLFFASPQLKEFYETKLSAKEVAEVKRMREVALEHEDGGFNIDATYWFATITSKINLLKEVEDEIAKSITQNVSNIHDEAFNSMIIGLVINMIVVFFIIGLGSFISRNLIKKVDMLKNEIDEIITSKDFSKTITKSGSDEIGFIQEYVNLLVQAAGRSMREAKESLEESGRYAKDIEERNEANKLTLSLTELLNDGAVSGVGSVQKGLGHNMDSLKDINDKNAQTGIIVDEVKHSTEEMVHSLNNISQKMEG